MKEVKDIYFEELAVAAGSKTGNKRCRIALIVTDPDTVYQITMTKSNARYLVDKLKAAIRLA